MDKGEDKVRVRLMIEGRVQGVFFRASTVEQAARLGAKGWVKNCADGSVELVAEGKKKDLNALIAWCYQGPPGANVRNVRVQVEIFTGEFQDFRIRR